MIGMLGGLAKGVGGIVKKSKKVDPKSLLVRCSKLKRSLVNQKEVH